MSRLERVVYIFIIFVLVFSGSASPGAEAAPQEATTLKVLTIPSTEFEPLTEEYQYINAGNIHFHGITTTGAFRVWLKVPAGAKVRWVKMLVKDDNADAEQNACMTIYYLDLKKFTDTTNLGEVCTEGSSTAVRSLKLPLGGIKITRLNALSAHVDISDMMSIYGVRVGYVK